MATVEPIKAQNKTEEALLGKCRELFEMLAVKNRAYGNSALDPVRVFSKASPVEQILVRLDDKLSRLKRGKDTDQVPEDVIQDMAGYLILLMVAEDQAKANPPT